MSNKEVRKVNTKKKEVKNNKKIDKIKSFVNKNKNILLVSILGIIDIILIICFARDNYANYAEVDGNVIFVGKTKNLLFGRNYIGLIVTIFIYIYGLIVSKVLCKNKLEIKKSILWFILIFVVNMILFYVFTNKIY